MNDEDENVDGPDHGIPGAFLDLEKMKRPDGILTHALNKGQMGVLQSAMHAESKDEDYRQELKTGFFLSTNESDKVVAAINEAERYGCSLKPIVDWLIARSAGTNGGRLRAVFETISHTTFTTNYQGKNNNKGWNNDKSSRSQGSPLS